MSLRATWIKSAGALVGLALLAGRPLPSLASAMPAQTVAPLSPVERDVLNRLNAAREAAGVAAVRPAAEISGIAQARSADMVARRYFAHEIPGCAASLDRCNVLGILDSRHVSYRWAGEILEWNLFLTRFDQNQTDAMAVEDFLHSPLHRAILLDPRYTEAGVGVAIGPDEKMLLTVVFLQT